MFRFIDKMFIKLLSFSGSLAAKCVLQINELCQVGSALINANSNGTLYYLIAISVNKIGGSCNIIDDPYT